MGGGNILEKLIKSKKFKSIKRKIVTFFVVSMGIGMIFLTLSLTNSLNVLVSIKTEKETFETAQHYSSLFREVVDENILILKTLDSVVKMNIKNNLTDRYETELILKDILQSINTVDSLYLMFEPNAFDGRDSEFVASTVGSYSNGRAYMYAYREGDDFQTVTDVGIVNTETSDNDYLLDIYTIPKSTLQPYVSKPYEYVEDNGEVFEYITVSVPIILDGKFIGIAGSDYEAKNFYNILNTKIYDNGYIVLTSSDNKIIYSPDKSIAGEEAPKHFENVFVNNSLEIKVDKKVVLNGKGHFIIKAPVYFNQLNEVYCISVVVPNSEIFLASNLSILGVVIIIIITGVIITFASIKYTGKLFLPLSELAKISEKISEGDFNFQLPNTENDEIGVLNQGFSKIVYIVNNILEDTINLSTNHAKGNIDAVIDEDKYNGSFKTVAQKTSNMAREYSYMITEISNGLENFSNGRFNEKINQYPGKKVAITNAMTNLAENLSNVSGDLKLLINEASNGELCHRVDILKYSGDWQTLTQSLNELMDTIVSPINELTTVLDHVSKGQFSLLMQGEYKGQFLEMKTSLNSTISTIVEYIHEISLVLNKMADNNLNQEVTGEYVGEFSKIKESLNNILKNFSIILKNIGVTSKQLSEGAAFIASNTYEISIGVNNQRNSVNVLRSSVEKLEQGVSNEFAQAQSAKMVSEHSNKDIMMGNEEMDRLINSMNELGEVSKTITSIAKVIDSISFQIGLLSVNASIEASRAGIHGKGFSVVADEVRSLAGKSTESAKEIDGLIKSAVLRISEGAKNAHTTRSIMHEIIGGFTKTNELMDSISVSIEEQMNVIKLITDEVTQISQIASTNSTAVEQVVASTEELAGQSEVLSDTANSFKL